MSTKLSLSFDHDEGTSRICWFSLHIAGSKKFTYTNVILLGGHHFDCHGGT